MASIPARGSSTRCGRIRCSRSKLITEPWDLGPGGYQLGRHPPGFAEWNDRFRDTVRRFWRGDPGQRPGSPRGSRARPTCSTTSGAMRGRRSISSPRTTASRLPISRRIRRNTTKPTAGQPRRPRRQLQRELGRRRADRRRGDPVTRARRALDARDAVHRARHADAGGRRRVRPHAARQQQRVLPGQRAVVARLGSGARRRSGDADALRVTACRAAACIR